jgi:hypothetical protein
MGYLYVLKAPDYAKLGMTLNPAARLRNYTLSIDGEVRYAHVWSCRTEAMAAIERKAKTIAEKYDGLTAERLFTSAENLADVILNAAGVLGERLTEVSLSEGRTDVMPCHAKSPDPALRPLTPHFDEGLRLCRAFSDIGLPGERYGDLRDRAELIGAKPPALNGWLSGKKRTPAWVWIIIKLYSMLDADQRTEFRRWARNKFDS